MTTDEKVAVLFADMEVVKKQLDKQQDNINDIQEITSSIEKILERTSMMCKTIDKIDDRLSNVEKQPRDDFTHYKRLIIGCVVTGVLGAVVTAIMALILR